MNLMHLFDNNIGPHIASKITTDIFTVNKQSGHPLRLWNKDIQEINSLLRESRLLTLTAFSDTIESIESRHNCSVDWIHFLRYSLPTIVAGCYIDKRIQRKIMCISRITNLACQREIKKSNVPELRAAILEWSSWLKELVDAG
ncbi:hypothetical protein RMCBS344292_08918 [Rhizopus microsporus]|nr:hypothetical protein RMCBS344292_08918 [Rhizopus microsporus]